MGGEKAKTVLGKSCWREGGTGRRCTSQLMTNSMEKGEEQKDSSNGVRKSNRKTRGAGRDQS